MKTMSVHVPFQLELTVEHGWKFPTARRDDPSPLNAFTAVVTSLLFSSQPTPSLEQQPAGARGRSKKAKRETEVAMGVGSGPQDRSASAKEPAGAERTVVSLVAILPQPQQRSDGAQGKRGATSLSESMKARQVTLASYAFYDEECVESGATGVKKTPSANQASASSVGSASGIHAVPVKLASPLLFASAMTGIRELRVVVSRDVGAKEEKEEGGGKRGRGAAGGTGAAAARTYSVSLCGLQQTQLTADQVSLLTSQSG